MSYIQDIPHSNGDTYSGLVVTIDKSRFYTSKNSLCKNMDMHKPKGKSSLNINVYFFKKSVSPTPQPTNK